MAKADDTFSSWLLTKLNALKLDENIFLNYILSILEDEETQDEKLDILKSVLGDSISSVSTFIILLIFVSFEIAEFIFINLGRSKYILC